MAAMGLDAKNMMGSIVSKNLRLSSKSYNGGTSSLFGNDLYVCLERIF